MELSPLAARRIVETVGSSGTPPPWGFQYFTAGLEPYLEVLEDDYFKEYLKEGGLSKAEIAFMVGFSDQSNFARAFKRWTGMSPGEYQDAA